VPSQRVGNMGNNHSFFFLARGEDAARFDALLASVRASIDAEAALPTAAAPAAAAALPALLAPAPSEVVALYVRAPLAAADGAPPAPLEREEALGFVAFSHAVGAGEAFLRAVYVCPAHRGQGHGPRAVAALRERLGAGVLALWPLRPTEGALEFARTKLLGSPAGAVAAWLLLRGGAAPVPFYLPAGLPADDAACTLTALSAPGALVGAARAQQWDLTALTKAFATFLSEVCGWEGEHALAVALLAMGDAFEGFGGGGEGDVEEREEEEEEDEGVGGGGAEA
jgi:GNAT superfamily N-acetyltransferase